MTWHVFYVPFMFPYADLLIKAWGVEHPAEVPESSASGRSYSPSYNYSSEEDAMCFSGELTEWKEIKNLEYFHNSATNQLHLLDHVTLKNKQTNIQHQKTPQQKQKTQRIKQITTKKKPKPNQQTLHKNEVELRYVHSMQFCKRLDFMLGFLPHLPYI